MLVLLIVFMVAAPLMTSGVNVDLPKASAAPLSQDSEPVTVSVNAEGKVYLQENEAALPDLVREVADGHRGQDWTAASTCAATRASATAGSWR